MSSSNKQVQPTPFEAASPAAPVVSESASGERPPWLVPALGVLLLLAAIVIFWLPAQVGEAPSPAAPGNSAPEPTVQAPQVQPAAPSEAQDQASPWSDAQLAKLRKEAQDVLEALLEIQFDLQERGVEQWGAEAFSRATAAATAADELYRQREYPAATENYQAALLELQSLQARIPAEVDRLLEETRLAIEAGKETAAREALDLATVIEEENGALPGLRERLSKLPALMALRDQAASAEQVGDLALAEQRLEEATTLDPAHQGSAEELRRVAELHRRARFNSFMSDGYSALDEGQFDLARQAFRQAAALNPGSAETATALEDVEAAQAARRLAGLRDQGRGNEQRERWSEAVKLYEEALRLDANVVFAREGLQRSQPRAELDAKLREIIAQPERLSDTRIARDAQALLQQAEQVSTAGPVLRKQVDELRTLLEKANTQITVTLYSDSETEVVVQKVARRGRFEQRQLSLRPGTYVAVGSRAGYRDIRQKFTVSHEAGASPVTVICQEPI